jgi:hypothetical protein
MDTPVFKTLRIAPTTQQGGTQTIQQSIYLTHNNPCGANLLVFQEMGKTQIRYIDLKNYLDDILDSEEMKALFEQVRIAATEYINTVPTDFNLYRKYLYMLMEWGKKAIGNLPVAFDYYPGYVFRVDVYDACGIEIYDSFYPILEIESIDPVTGQYIPEGAPLVRSQIKYSQPEFSPLYKLVCVPTDIPFIKALDIVGFSTLLSNFLYNQSGLPENVMSIASLLIDSANTRTFGIPKYGFSARENLSPFGGISYNCCQFIDVRTMPDANGATTLVSSIFMRLSLNEDTFFFGSTTPLTTTLEEEQPTPPFIEQLMADPEIMNRVVRLVNTDLENLETNKELLKNGQNEQVFLKYYGKLLGKDLTSSLKPDPVLEEFLTSTTSEE